jgi:DNA-binding protein HU-beta
MDRLDAIMTGRQCHAIYDTREIESQGTPTVNMSELVAKLAEAHGVSKAQAKSIVDDILRNIVAAAASGADVSLPGFGKFKVKATPEREGRNPANGERIKIAASRKLAFSSAKSVKDLLNS